MTLVKIQLPQNPPFVLLEAVRDAGLVPSDSDDAIILWKNFSLINLHLLDFSTEPKYRIYNHINSSDILCYGSSFCRIVQKLQLSFPEEYSFIPNAFILPYEKLDFLKALKKGKKQYLYKRDKEGEFIANPSDYLSVSDEPAVAIEKIDTVTLNQKHFHIKLFVFIPSVEKLSIYTFKESLIIFNDSLHGNKTTEETEVDFFNNYFPTLEKDFGFTKEKFDLISQKIIILSVLAAYKYLYTSNKPNFFYSNTFQLMTFNFVFDKHWTPFLLSIDPNVDLSYHTNREKKMKIKMLSDILISISPMAEMQQIIEARKYWTNSTTWNDFVIQHPTLKSKYESYQDFFIGTSDFQKIYPNNDPLYNDVKKFIASQTPYLIPGYQTK